MRRRGVEVPPVLLGVLAMVALVAVEPEDPFLDERVFTVPERERQAQALRVVTDAAEAVLVPPVCTRPRVRMRERPPGVAVGGVVLADRAPCPLRQVRTPAHPRRPITGESLALRVH